MSRLVLAECHEEVADADGHSEPCNRPAVGWRIEPEEHQPYPVCFTHHRWPYADEWVEAINELEALRGVVAAVETLFGGGPDTPCRTVWREENPGNDHFSRSVECVEVPLDDLRAALGGSDV